MITDYTYYIFLWLTLTNYDYYSIDINFQIVAHDSLVDHEINLVG